MKTAIPSSRWSRIAKSSPTRSHAGMAQTRNFRRAEDGALEGGCLQLSFQLSFAPLLANRQPHVEFSFFRALGFA